MQIHTGGVYGDKPAAMDRFVREYDALLPAIRRRLVIENDERQYGLSDNLAIHARTGIPVLFDVFHHAILNDGESLPEAMDLFMPTWRGHGLPAMDYSAQHAEKQAGAHAISVDLAAFDAFLGQIADRDVDIMLEIKDKENSALAVLAALADRQVERRQAMTPCCDHRSCRGSYRDAGLTVPPLTRTLARISWFAGRIASGEARGNPV